jgi:hypothetical protein
MKAQENNDDYNLNDRKYQMAQEAVDSENTDTPIHHDKDNERSADHQPTELDHDDADRRTLDESEADEDDE